MGDGWEKTEGSASPLGVTWIEKEKSYNFSLYAKDAEAVVLHLYNDKEFEKPLYSVPFTFPNNKTGRVWHLRVPEQDIPDAKYYAYCISGPFIPNLGQRFDSAKILLDPYAKGFFFPPSFSREAACRPGFDNSGKAPLGVLPQHTLKKTLRHNNPQHDHDLVIYEMHVRGFTYRDNSNVPVNEKGTFAGVIRKM